MTPEELIMAALQPLVSQRCYIDRFPQEPLPTWPAIRFGLVGGDAGESLCGAGDEADDMVRVQVDAVTERPSERAALRPLIRAAMRAIGATQLGAPMHTWDADTRTYRLTADFRL